MFGVKHECSSSECINTRRRILRSCFLASAVKTTINKPEKTVSVLPIDVEKGVGCLPSQPRTPGRRRPLLQQKSLCSKSCLSNATLWPRGGTGGRHSHFALAPGDCAVTDHLISQDAMKQKDKLHPEVLLSKVSERDGTCATSCDCSSGLQRCSNSGPCISPFVGAGLTPRRRRMPSSLARGQRP